ncbi:sensor histidine kinase [Kitasatospora viridis]|uniref:histidine kinase n=1 Tax=Kitasatospora viridis TaxID=281105 RepID=A0A561UCC6_9ACTN|nr:histidine kinase [Kitasatospora viridis]TWF97024.1 signal transduction histidine kinase [Kitasatospora viridis]
MRSIRGLAQRRVVRDTALAVAVGLAAAAGLRQTSSWQAAPARSADAVGYLLIALGAAALALRRGRPQLVLACTTAATAVTLLLHYPYGPSFLAAGLAMYFVAAALPWPRSVALCVAACGVLTGAVVVAAWDSRLAMSQVMVGGAVGWMALPCLLGVVLRVRREDLAQSRAEAVKREAYAERLRIARAVHETAGQGLAAINIQSAAALRLAEGNPRGALDILRTINTTSKVALQELRATLGTLEKGDRAVPRAPLPGLSSLPSLISAMSSSGLYVRVLESGCRGELSVAVDLAAFRIVQHSLANVLRHASGTVATVEVEYGDDQLLLQITDNRDPEAQVRSSEQDSTGILEQAAAVGGKVDLGPAADGPGFRVCAKLPRR